jgi:anti-sigma factor RsiW
MNCKQFENLVSEYLDETLNAAERAACAAHVIQCRSCRALLDDVRAAMIICRRVAPVEAPADLEGRILELTAAGAMMSCAVFDELIVDYFDGFITASEFHLFERHFEACPRCKRLLESIELARELCQQIKTVEVPEGLNERILETTAAANRPTPDPLRGNSKHEYLNPKRFRISDFGFRISLKGLLRPARTPEFLTAMVLCLATVGLLLVDFSDDHSLRGVYRRASQRAEQILNQPVENERIAASVEGIKATVSGVIQIGLALFSKRPESPSTPPDSSPKSKPPHHPNESAPTQESTEPKEQRATDNGQRTRDL